MEIKRIFDFAYYQLEKAPQNNCFNYKKKKEWVSISTAEYIEKAKKVSASLLKLGLEKGEKIAVITTNNHPHWHILDVGVSQIGVQNVPLYATLSAKDYAYILTHSDSKYCFVSDKKLFDKVKSVQKETNLKDVFYLIDSDSEKDWSSFLAIGSEGNYEAYIQKRSEEVNEDDIATIIYTSGTTGVPKGVMLTHKNIVFTVFATSKGLNLSRDAKRIVSYLPICHIFERAACYYNQYVSLEVYFAQSIETIGDTIRETKPHYLAVVPRLLEKIFDKIMDKGSSLEGFKKKLFFWAVELAEQYEAYGKNGFWYHTKLAIARALIFKKWREALGNNLQFMVCGSAPLQARLIRIFTAAGIPILEGYGMTESSPGGTLNDLRNGGFRIGSVGKPLEGIQVKIAADGEILLKGENVMAGYYKNEALTQKTIIDGFLHTGDIGRIDSDGFLYITDRKKEMFKTSGGKYIAPAALESELKQSRFIEQVMVIGEGQKMPAAIIQVNFEFVHEWAKRKGYEITNVSTDEKLIQRIQQEVDTYNQRFGKWEQIKKFEITPDEWTITEGLLTPTLKIRRKNIRKKYDELYHKIYG